MNSPLQPWVIAIMRKKTLFYNVTWSRQNNSWRSLPDSVHQWLWYRYDVTCWAPGCHINILQWFQHNWFSQPVKAVWLGDGEVLGHHRCILSVDNNTNWHERVQFLEDCWLSWNNKLKKMNLMVKCPSKPMLEFWATSLSKMLLLFIDRLNIFFLLWTHHFFLHQQLTPLWFQTPQRYHPYLMIKRTGSLYQFVPF